MNAGNRDVFVYLLIDNGLLQEVAINYIEADAKSRPTWLAMVYPDHAMAVSPFLVDVEAAYEAGDLDQVMSYLTARTPALHVSIIESELPLDQIAHHLRRFIFIVNPESKQFTLRYADCVVLAMLPSVLTAEQWASMRRPINRWGVHDRANAVVHLPPTDGTKCAETPLALDNVQLSLLDEASEPDHYIAKVAMMRNHAPLPGKPVERHEWSQAARQAWRAAGNSNSLTLMFLTEAALVTCGEILRRQEVPTLLAMNEANACRSKLREMTKEILLRQNRALQYGTENGKSNIDDAFI